MAHSITQGGLTITPVYDPGKSYLSLRELIADSETWQKIVANPTMNIENIRSAGSGDRDDALARVYLYEVLDEGSNDDQLVDFPTCVLEFQTGEQLAERYGPGAFYIRTAFYVEFCFVIPDEYLSLGSMAHMDATEKIGQIVFDIMSPGVSPGERYQVDDVTIMSLRRVQSNVTQGLEGYVCELLVNAESSQ